MGEAEEEGNATDSRLQPAACSSKVAARRRIRNAHLVAARGENSPETAQRQHGSRSSIKLGGSPPIGPTRSARSKRHSTRNVFQTRTPSQDRARPHSPSCVPAVASALPVNGSSSFFLSLSDTQPTKAGRKSGVMRNWNRNCIRIGVLFLRAGCWVAGRLVRPHRQAPFSSAPHTSAQPGYLGRRWRGGGGGGRDMCSTLRG